MQTLARLAAALSSGRTTSRALVEQCLARIADTSGEGARVFVRSDAHEAISNADRQDRLRKLGAAPSPFAGIPLSVKDLFDVEGEVTTAGSVLLRDAPPARADATAVARLKSAGFVLVGRTNMTEFAFSGLGINAHYGTPLNPYDRATARIPGGSSSGAAVSVTDGMCYGGLGTDTGGSCRIPAALCGIVGFKPTACRIPPDGAFPLSPSLDSVGPLAGSVSCCATLDAVLAGTTSAGTAQMHLPTLRFAVPRSYVLEGMDRHVSSAFDAAIAKISDAGASVADIPLVELLELREINRLGGFAAAEAYAIHRARIAGNAPLYDARVLSRILRGKEQSAADYFDLVQARADFKSRIASRLAPYDAVLMPTVPIIAPPLSQLEPEEAYVRLNFLMLRNPSVVNFLDGCAISIPCHAAGTAPVGLMIMGRHGEDRSLLAMAAAIERLIGTPAHGETAP